MKKLLPGSVAMLLTMTLFAQPEKQPDGPPKPPPIAERWRHDSTKLQLYVVLNSGEMAGAKASFLSFYNDMDALMQPTNSKPPAPPARADVERIHTKRNNALKAIFSAQQFERFETFEREFMPPPPPHPFNPPKPGDAAEKV